MKNIKNKIESKGVKPTFHRIKIMEYLLKHENHPTVDTIYEEIIKDIPTISRTTVYNTLNLFVETKLIRSLNVRGTETRYDADMGSHHHFICNECDTIYNIDIICNFACEQHKMVDGNEIQEIHSHFKGICKNCLTKNRDKEK